jgi:hypothetical protein
MRERAPARPGVYPFSTFPSGSGLQPGQAGLMHLPARIRQSGYPQSLRVSWEAKSYRLRALAIGVRAEESVQRLRTFHNVRVFMWGRASARPDVLSTTQAIGMSCLSELKPGPTRVSSEIGCCGRNSNRRTYAPPTRLLMRAANEDSSTSSVLREARLKSSALPCLSFSAPITTR